MTPEHPTDPTVRTIQLTKGKATYTLEGEGAGPTLVAIHGLPGSVRDFRWLATSLGGSVRMLRLNMPGFHGTDISCSPGASLEARVDFVCECLEALKVDSFVVMGHSMGGPVAMGVATRMPERVKGVALIASVALRPHRGYRNSPIKLVSNILKIPGASWVLKSRIKEGFVKGGFSSSTPYREMLRALFYVGGFSFEVNRTFHSQVTAPMLVSWAEDDVFIEKGISEELAEASQAGPRLAFATGGHNIQKTQAVELAEAIVPWMQTL